MKVEEGDCCSAAPTLILALALGSAPAAAVDAVLLAGSTTIAGPAEYQSSAMQRVRHFRAYRRDWT